MMNRYGLACMAAGWLSVGAGLPRLRRQTVRFPGGEMRVTERYSAVLID